VVRSRCPDGLVALCNVAGIMRPRPLLGCDDADVDVTLAINAAGPIRLCRLLLPSLLRGQGGGTILNLTSTGGLDSWPWTGAYTASKHALEGASNAIRREAIANGLPLRVVMVEPGPVNTPLAAAVPKLGKAWCDAHASNPFTPAFRKTSDSSLRAMDSWGFTPSSFRLG
jgi:NAD(P)-dependent dehydrogenase (short-subunit alcohol dehydrogenase family)